MSCSCVLKDRVALLKAKHCPAGLQARSPAYSQSHGSWGSQALPSPANRTCEPSGRKNEFWGTGKEHAWKMKLGLINIKETGKRG